MNRSCAQKDPRCPAVMTRWPPHYPEHWEAPSPNYIGRDPTPDELDAYGPEAPEHRPTSSFENVGYVVSGHDRGGGQEQPGWREEWPERWEGGGPEGLGRERDAREGEEVVVVGEESGDEDEENDGESSEGEEEHDTGEEEDEQSDEE